MIKNISKHWLLILVGIFLVIYFFARYYTGHNSFLMEANGYSKNYDSLVGIIIGASLTYWYSWKQKRNENTERSKTALRFAFLVMMLQRATLEKSISEALNQTNKRDSDGRPRFTHTKWDISSVSIKIDQELLQSILLDHKVCKYENLTTTLQVLIRAEDRFRDCINLVDRFNRAIDQSQLDALKIKAAGKIDIPKDEFPLPIREAMALVNNISEAQKGALHLNKLAQEGLDLLSRACFKEFKMPKIDGMKPFSEISSIQELFSLKNL